MNTTNRQIVVPLQFCAQGNSRLAAARKHRDEAQRALDSTLAAAKALALKIDRARTVRMERFKQAEATINTLLASRRGKDATEFAEAEILWLIGEIKTADEERDKSWIAWKILCLTSWRGIRILSEVEAAIGQAFPENIPDKMAEKLARLIERQEKFLREQAKRNGTMRPGKTAKERTTGKHDRHRQNRAIAALEQAERAQGHPKGGKSK